MPALTRQPVDPVDVARLNALVNRLAAIAEDDLAVSEAAGRAAELLAASSPPTLGMTDGELAERGWTRRELVIAMDARSSKKDVPYYVVMAHERVLSRQRLMAAAVSETPRARGYVIPVPEAGEK